jgi:hypothetical protein
VRNALQLQPLAIATNLRRALVSPAEGLSATGLNRRQTKPAPCRAERHPLAEPPYQLSFLPLKEQTRDSNLSRGHLDWMLFLQCARLSSFPTSPPATRSARGSPRMTARVATSVRAAASRANGASAAASHLPWSEVRRLPEATLTGAGCPGKKKIAKRSQFVVEFQRSGFRNEANLPAGAVCRPGAGVARWGALSARARGRRRGLGRPPSRPASSW